MTSFNRMAQIKNGKWKEFNKHAVLIAEGYYQNGKKHGCWREYYDFTGSLMIEEYYLHGIQHGRYSAYHPNGQLWSEGNFNYGLREGFFKIYDDHGNLTRKLLFVRDSLMEDVEEYKSTHETTSEQTD